jgi:hypothetical protein
MLTLELPHPVGVDRALVQQPFGDAILQRVVGHIREGRQVVQGVDQQTDVGREGVCQQRTLATRQREQRTHVAMFGEELHQNAMHTRPSNGFRHPPVTCAATGA